VKFRYEILDTMFKMLWVVSFTVYRTGVMREQGRVKLILT